MSAQNPAGRRRVYRVLVAVVISVGCLLSKTYGAQIISRFDLDAEGWIMADMPYPNGPFTTAVTNYPTNYSSTNGHPDGHIWLRDPMSSRVFYFQAPTNYLGAHSNFYDGTLSFDIKRQNGSLLNYPDVAINGGGFTFIIDVGSGPVADVWTNYTLRLNETGGWKKDRLSGDAPTAAEFKTLLNDLTALRIRGEYSTSSTDLGFLDNVIMSTPEPLLLNVQSWTAQEIMLCWNSETGRVYQLQFSASLPATNWSNALASRTGTGSNDCVSLTATNPAERFFRLVRSP